MTIRSLLSGWIKATVLLLAATASSACMGQGEAYTDIFEAGPDYEVQGEYQGTLKHADKELPYGVQVIALGDGKFDAVLYAGGLPGDGWQRGDKRVRFSGAREGDGKKVKFKQQGDGERTIEELEYADGKLTFLSTNGASDTFRKVNRQSITLEMEPPENAIVLFDGTNADEWENGTLTANHLLNVGVKSKREFKDFQLHLEFRTPFMPKARGQGRGNSGVYLQNRYEVQILDSFGLEGEDNECGGIYKEAKPIVNMCLPPLVWQTYDIDFTAARFNEKGEKIKDAVVTVRHNGVVIHDRLKLSNVTPGGEAKEAPGKGPIVLQNHGNPVHFRNIWVVEKK